jgi:hypothetical protein
LVGIVSQRIWTGQYEKGMEEAFMFGAGLVWLMLRPGKVPLYVLIALQFVGLTTNTYDFAQAEVASLVHKALSVALLFRVLSVGASVLAIREISRLQPKAILGNGAGVA